MHAGLTRPDNFTAVEAKQMLGLCRIPAAIAVPICCIRTASQEFTPIRGLIAALNQTTCCRSRALRSVVAVAEAIASWKAICVILTATAINVNATISTWSANCQRLSVVNADLLVVRMQLDCSSLAIATATATHLHSEHEANPEFERHARTQGIALASTESNNNSNNSHNSRRSSYSYSQHSHNRN